MKMKLWQLDSILCANRNRGLSVKVAALKVKWSYLKPVFESIEIFYENTDKNTLDIILPSDFVIQVLSESDIVCYKTRIWYENNQCWQSRLKSRSYSHEDEKIAAVDVYIRYGGDVLENVFEKGVVEVADFSAPA